MTAIAAVIVGVLSACGCIWLGFWLGRQTPDADVSLPAAVLPEHYDGSVLDYAVYEKESE